MLPAALVARALPYRWIAIGVLFLALLAAVGVQTVRLAEAESALAKQIAACAKQRQKHAEEREIDQRAARTTEHRIYENADAQRISDAKKLAAVSADRDRLELLLRDRPSRPAQPGAVAAASGAAGSSSASATGAQLYREDGQLLAGEAARAERVLAERDSCIRQYNDAREALSRGQKELK